MLPVLLCIALYPNLITPKEIGFFFHPLQRAAEVDPKVNTHKELIKAEAVPPKPNSSVVAGI